MTSKEREQLIKIVREEVTQYTAAMVALEFLSKTQISAKTKKNIEQLHQLCRGRRWEAAETLRFEEDR